MACSSMDLEGILPQAVPGSQPTAAIRSATAVAAELLGWQDRLGTIEAGKLADIIAVAGDPLTDIGELEKVQFVMKAGVVYKAAR